ncbi:MAG: penicillin-binding transpeptidase domain-containing protein [Clostridiales bacterium]|nr:PASTA domain-containing protein [Clostridiales bacterium]MDD7523401.1 penicillin-binding transpeptidase domain-containing protein [Clostridiales bacterium]MDD7687834.1 penicillin-binding transpeptidase domain-containing protein [Clostridiales bacterium]MDY2597974.1 penicillin-binding transpeptidase domain-containing protein [Eubacteriales bacterium]MDY4622317.1 penicillin-binding transpeptidase domain-containing protein [Eubacteriales bacterium]
MGQNKNVKTKEERTPKKKKTRYGKRIAFLETALLLAFIIVIIDIFCIMVVLGPERLEVAVQQWTRTSTITANRGQIVDCNGKVLATTGAVYKILLWPKNITSGSEERVARELSDALDLDFDYVYKCATNKTRSEFVIKRQVDSKTVSNVRSLKLSGVGIANDSKRYYPYGTLLSQVIGFTTRDNVGQSGLELKYDKYLTGSDGKLISETDSSGNPLAYGYTQYEDPIDGAKIVLTVDQVFQSYLENALEEALSVNNASSAQGIILDVNTGAIKAISTKPDYDPNDPPRNDLEQLAELSRNRLVTDVYEPGSTFKILTLAAAIDSGNADLNSTFFCNGGYIVNGERIKCWKHAGHGSQDLTKATENSCNCCFMQLALRMGVSEFYDYLYAFGLGQKTGDIFDGESSGIVTNEKYVTENDLARIGFGQSVAVTPIQLAAAVSAAVNGGYLYSPYIVEQVVSSDGTVIEQADPSPVRQVISGETSATVRQILQSVVDNGTGRNAKIEGYYVGGKTGTAQKYDEYGRVSAGSYICSFIGFAPADDPQYLCLILVDEPHVGSIFGSTVAAPFVRRVLSEILPYSGIQPSHLSETVTVPNVLGLTTEEANKELAKVGLIGFYECADEVTLQLPAAGETVVKGSSVLLYTGSDDVNIDNEPVIAPLMVEMPDLMDMTAVQAYNALTALGLNMVCSPEDPHGVVLGQSIYAGTMVEYGSSVTLYFGIKPEE